MSLAKNSFSIVNNTTAVYLKEKEAGRFYLQTCGVYDPIIPITYKDERSFAVPLDTIIFGRVNFNPTSWRNFWSGGPGRRRKNHHLADDYRNCRNHLRLYYAFRREQCRSSERTVGICAAKIQFVWRSYRNGEHPSYGCAIWCG